MATDAREPVFPNWLRVVLILAIAGLWLAYLAAPLWGSKVQMPTALEISGGGAIAAIMGRDVWRRLTQ